MAAHYRWDDLPREQLGPLTGRRLITGERMMLAHVYLAKGAIVPLHVHENEQLTYILEGTLRFWLGEDGRVEAAMNVDVWDVVEPLQALIRSGRPVPVEHLADPAVPLDQLLAGSPAGP